MNKLLAILMMWLISAPIYLPGLLARLGIYKSWYFARFIPPFSWRRGIHLWPMSAFFICYPLLALSSLSDRDFEKVSVLIGIAGIIFAFVLVVWNPRWAKPIWQRRVEDRYSWDEINNIFLPVWREMNRREWGQLIETEEGLAELVRIAREQRSIK